MDKRMPNNPDLEKIEDEALDFLHNELKKQDSDSMTGKDLRTLYVVMTGKIANTWIEDRKDFLEIVKTVQKITKRLPKTKTGWFYVLSTLLAVPTISGLLVHYIPQWVDPFLK